MKTSHFWKFTGVKAQPPRQSLVPLVDSRPTASNDEPKHMAEVSVDIGTDEDALRWAEEHDPETAELLKAEEIE